MLNVVWLKSGSNGGQLKKDWGKDNPLTVADGGCLPPFSEAEFKRFEPHFRAGSSMTALGTLGWLSNELSNPRFLMQAEQIEKLARKAFTDGGGADPANSQIGVSPDYYERHSVQFPSSWPEKYVLPIVVRDLSKPPKKLQLLALDEMVLAFWKMVDRVRGWEGIAQRALADDAENVEKQQKLEALRSTLYQARHLHNNVPCCFIYADTEAVAYDLSLRKREEVEDLREFCGINGWNRVLTIGRKRDALRRSNAPHSKDDVSAALAHIRWGAGREVTPGSVQAALTMYDKVNPLPGLAALIHESFGYWGRSSPFEDTTRLNHILKAGTGDELVWVTQTIMEEKTHGRRTDNYSCAELARKASPVGVMKLRRLALLGVNETIVARSLAVTAESGETPTAATSRNHPIFVREPPAGPSAAFLKTSRKPSASHPQATRKHF